MTIGFLEIDGNKYCFDANGVMYCDGIFVIDGIEYVFDVDGCLIDQ